MNDDGTLRAQILSAFGSDARLNNPRIRVAVDDGAVWLSGDIGTPEAKRAAEQAAREVPGVRSVTNNLHVRKNWVEVLAGAVSPDGHQAADAAILDFDARGLRTHHNGKSAAPPRRSGT